MNFTSTQKISLFEPRRNPFVDYPELATALYGEPEDIAEGTRTYPTCIADFPTPAPTATRNDCGSIDPGDVPVFLVNTDNPDEVVFLPLADIPPDMELFITDQAWNGTHFIEGVENEGTSMVSLLMAAPPNNSVTFFLNYAT